MRVQKNISLSGTLFDVVNNLTQWGIFLAGCIILCACTAHLSFIYIWIYILQQAARNIQGRWQRAAIYLS